MQRIGMLESNAKVFSEILQEQMEQFAEKSQKALLENQQDLLHGSVAMLDNNVSPASSRSVSARRAEMEEKNAGSISNLFAKEGVVLSRGAKAMLAKHKANKSIQASKLAGMASLLAATVSQDSVKASREERAAAVKAMADNAGVRDFSEIMRQNESKMVHNADRRAAYERRVAEAQANGESIPVEVPADISVSIPATDSVKVAPMPASVSVAVASVPVKTAHIRVVI